jgi:signal recognition particle subunit SEC65
METKNRQDINKDIIKFYPSYIDTNQTVNNGRRVSKNLSSPDVNLQEIFNIVSQALKLKCTPENKHFPSDWMKRGRLLVNLKENGVVVNGLITNSK